MLYVTSRVAFTVASNFGIDFGIIPANVTLEIILLFVTLFALILVFKRFILGGFIYFGVYLVYFGTSLFNESMVAMNTPELANFASIFMSIIGIMLAIAVLGDILLNKNREAKKTGDKKTDWYYKNKDYDRVYDERADKNNYRTM